MKLIRNITVLLIPTVLTIGAANSQGTLEITSESVVDGRIQKVHACTSKGGKDQPVQLSVLQIPPEAKFLSIIVDDPDAIPVAGKNWVHWNLFNIPAQERLDIPVGKPPFGDPGRSSGGSKTYEGMCPPNGTHKYRFAAYATVEKLDVGGFFGPTAMHMEIFESKFKKAILGKGMLTGEF